MEKGCCIDRKKITTARLNKNLSMETLAEMCGVSRITIWRIESYSHHEIKDRLLFKLSKALGVDIDSIRADSDSDC